MKIKASFIFLLIVFFSVSGYCEEKNVKVYFGNGIKNELREARNGLKVLKILLENRIQETELMGMLDYGVSHNPTNGFFKDILEAGFQILGLADREIWRFLSGLDIMPDELQERYSFYASQITQNLLTAEPKMQEHIKKYNEDLCSGNKVVVVAHSQGNLYANVAYLGIKESVKDGFGIVSVANPDTFVAGGGTHTNIDEDLVIKVTPGVILSSFPNFEDLSYQNPDDWSGHKLIDSYLAQGRLAETKILNDIVSTIGQLEWPEGTCPQNYLIATSYIYDDSYPNGKGSPDYCIIWDLENNKIAKNISLDNGNIATFPCEKELLSNWLLNGSFSGTPVLRTSPPYTGTFSWVPSGGLNWIFPDDAVEKHSNTFPCDYPNETPLSDRCWLVPITRSDNLGGYSMLDEKGNSDLSAHRQWYYGKYIASSDEVGFIMTGTIMAPSIPNRDNPFEIPTQIDITSLTNQGGTRRRVVNGFYTRYWEFFNTQQSEWPQTEFDYNGQQLKYSAELRIKNPFDSDFINIPLQGWNLQNGLWDGDCDGTGTVKDGVKDDVFQASGIHNNDYMVVFYSEYLKTIRTGNPCSSTSWGYSKCKEGQLHYVSGYRWEMECLLYEQTTTLQEWPFKIKAFSRKVEEGENIMDMNPFDLPDNVGLSEALKHLTVVAALNSYPEVDPESINTNTKVSLNFFELD